MDMSTIIELINNFGFPVAVCAALFWYLLKTDSNHKEEVEKLRQTIDNNTLILTKLYERLGGEHK